MTKKSIYWAVHGETIYALLKILNEYMNTNVEVVNIFTPSQTSGEGWVALLLMDAPKED